MSTLYCQYDLGFDLLLVGNGFHYFLFLFNFIIFVCYLRIVCIHILNDFYNPRINKAIAIIIIPNYATRKLPKLR